MTEAEAIHIAHLVSLKAEIQEWIETVDEYTDDNPNWAMLLEARGKRDHGGQSVQSFGETDREFRPEIMRGALVAAHQWADAELLKLGVTP